MGVIGRTSLRTRSPKDIKKVLDYCIEQTKIQSLKDTGIEWQPNQAVGKDWDGAQRFDIFEDCIVWQDNSYSYPNNLNIEELATKIAKQFPEIEFVLSEYNDSCPGNVYEHFWDGKEWIEMQELALGFIIDCDDKEKAKEKFRVIIENRLRPTACAGYLRLIEAIDSDNLYVRCQFAVDVPEVVFGHIEEFLKKIDCNLHGILTEYQGAGETLLKKVTVTDKEIKWADCTEEEVNNFYGEVNAEEVKKIFR